MESDTDKLHWLIGPCPSGSPWNNEIYFKGRQELLTKCYALAELTGLELVDYGKTVHPLNHSPADEYDKTLIKTVESIDHVLIIGLDYPFFSVKEIHDFVIFALNQRQQNHQDSICSFRKTPSQKNIAVMDKGGLISYMVSRKDGRISIVAHENSFNAHDQKTSAIEICRDEIKISSEQPLLFIMHDELRSFRRFWQSDSKYEGIDDEFITCTQHENTFLFKFKKDCIIEIIESIHATDLYSRVNYFYTPVTVPGVLDSDITQTRINITLNKKIYGRQDFPETYEPFWGMVMTNGREARQLLDDPKKWFATQHRLKPYIINSDPVLIEENPLDILMKLENGRNHG